MFVVSGSWSDGRIVDGTEHEFSSKAAALRAAKALLRDRLFEGDSVRVITSDGEPVWDSRRGEGKAPRKAKGTVMAKEKYEVRERGDLLITLKVKLPMGTATMNAYEYVPPLAERHGGAHTRLDLELKYKGKTLFKAGQLWIGIPSHQSIDGDYAERAVAETFALKPGDTDRDFFAGYSAEQLEFVSRWGDYISMWIEEKYGES